MTDFLRYTICRRWKLKSMFMVVVMTLPPSMYVIFNVNNPSPEVFPNEEFICINTFQTIAGITDKTDIFLRDFKDPIPISTLSPSCQHILQPPKLSAEDLKKDIKCFLTAPFPPNTTKALMRSFKKMKQRLDINRVTLVMIGNSLIGSVHYHGFIPYDHDLDFGVPIGDMELVRMNLKKLQADDPEIFMLVETRHTLDQNHIKFVISVPGLDGIEEAPSIVAYFLGIDCTHAEECWIPGESRNSSGYFYLMSRPFEGMLLNVMVEYKAYLRSSYANYAITCSTGVPLGLKRKRICEPTPCRLLHRFFPYVLTFSHERDRSVLEVLVNQGYVRGLFFSRSEQ